MNDDTYEIKGKNGITQYIFCHNENGLKSGLSLDDLHELSKNNIHELMMFLNNKKEKKYKLRSLSIEFSHYSIEKGRYIEDNEMHLEQKIYYPGHHQSYNDDLYGNTRYVDFTLYEIKSMIKDYFDSLLKNGYCKLRHIDIDQINDKSDLSSELEKRNILKKKSINFRDILKNQTEYSQNKGAQKMKKYQPTINDIANDLAFNDLLSFDFDQLIISYGDSFTPHQMQSAILQCSIMNISRYIAKRCLCSTMDLKQCLNECSDMIKRESIKESKKMIKEDD